MSEVMMKPVIDDLGDAMAAGKRPPVDNKGLRYDTGKNRLELIPPEWEWALGQVLTAGANKYAARNWERGMDWSHVAGPLRRHLNKFLRGHRYDDQPDAEGRPGTGCHHLALVAWNALALMSYDLRGVGVDDLDRADYTEETRI
jgi:hypothetical protein